MEIVESTKDLPEILATTGKVRGQRLGGQRRVQHVKSAPEPASH